jgi:predicted nucleic acid-binding protein
MLREGGVISVKVLNEMANVCRRKFNFSWDELTTMLVDLRTLLTVLSLTEVMHQVGLRISQHYHLSVNDAMIVGAALDAGCAGLWSEDMQHGLVIDDCLTIRNPFAVL